MKSKIVLYKPLPECQRQRLEALFYVTAFDYVNDHNQAEFMAALEDAEGLIGAGDYMGPEILQHAKKLRAASTISVGTDQYDLEYLASRNIPLMHTPGVMNNTTADTIFMLMMCAARRTVELSNFVRNGEWKGSIGEAFFGTDVYGKTLGIIGMGRIGYAIARRAHLGFDMNIQYYNRSQHKEAEQHLSATKMSLKEVLSSSDFICVMVPLTKETEGLIGQPEFELMKSSAIFVNGSRGKVVDEAALIDALTHKTIRAAGLDVFEVEPLPGDSPLCQLDNAVIVPHIGSATTETRHNMATCAVDNLIAALNGDVTKNCANHALLKS
ncbi:2-hydroxyacid dehydrogenase [Vibrio sp. RC27]